MADLSMLAPSGGQPPQGMPQKGMPQGAPQGAVGQNPGGIEALRNSVQILQKMGMDAEEIVQVVLQMAERLGLEIGEEQIRPIVEQAAGGQPPQGAAPMGGGEMPNLNLGA